MTQAQSSFQICLSRDQAERCEVNIKQNRDCHKSLETCSTPPPNETTWETYALVVLGGVILGATIEAQIQH